MGAGLELHGRRKDGTEFPIDVCLSQLETRGGGVLISAHIRDITGRKRSDDLLAHLAAIVQASDDAIIGKSLDGTIVSWNPGAERLYGYKAEEVVGRPISRLIPPDRHDEFARIMNGLRRGRRFERLETTRMHKDGHPIDVSITISPVKNSAGRVMGASVISRDITESKRTEELASHLAAIVEASDDAIAATSLDGTVVSWNSGAERLFGYKAEEVVGRRMAMLVPPDRADELGWIMKGLRQGKHIEHYETTRLHKDGHRIDISATVSPVRDRRGAVVGASVVARDITDRKRVEMALRQSEERFRVALKNAPVRVFHQDLDLRFTWINSNLFQWAKQDCLGKTDAEIVGGEEGARLTAFKREVLRTGQGARTEAEVTVDGEKYYFDLVAEPLRDANGTIVGLTCSATDITAAKKNLMERERLIAQLQEALDEVKMLGGLLSICASCKRIRNERNHWEPLESYIQSHSEAKFSHGVCPDCLRKLYPDYYQK
jgi:PAS domain S-box-containing protein